MLIIAIISDIHANLPALEAVLDDIDTRNIDQIYCLGDLVDFAPWPNEVIALIRQLRIPTLMGNHDERIAFDQPVIPLKKHNAQEMEARFAAIDYTRQAISAENKSFLASLPRQIQVSFSVADQSVSMLLVHASTRAIDEYIYEDHDPNDVVTMMTDKKADVLIMGHTHYSYIRPIINNTNTSRKGVTPVAINCGSVGRSKEADALATYLVMTVDGEQEVFRDDSITYELIKVNYPIGQTVEGIYQSSIPNFYADFLKRGLPQSV
ncbi:metallophosphoesterase family protein [Spirosoma endophyticum]|uniref:UDP-2,3-diacylglucosamine pyrophosphatase LpxH n=1 Tax=Spirosoma endophyticum TaxID=662367 RepID=A0A1I1T203_9BACT|nr:metallophosphoesterase family protein [Spirosoma endophyticum]SFD52719.1 UDP-2,3-diacylglucosamine pyrophosphatase LpxH [Spirosoma endophyticum]